MNDHSDVVDLTRGLERWHKRTRPGAITSRTGFLLTSLRKWREEILLQEPQIIALADLGYGVLDRAMLETAAYLVRRHPTINARHTNGT